MIESEEFEWCLSRPGEVLRSNVVYHDETLKKYFVFNSILKDTITTYNFNSDKEMGRTTSGWRSTRHHTIIKEFEKHLGVEPFEVGGWAKLKSDKVFRFGNASADVLDITRLKQVYPLPSKQEKRVGNFKIKFR